MRSRSRHSRRTLPTQRSTCAFAFGARSGVRMTRMLSPAKRASNCAENLRLGRGRGSAPGARDRRGPSASCAPAAASKPCPGSPCRGEVFNPTAADREQDKHVQAAKPDGVDGQEVASDDRIALLAQEAAPGQLVALRRGRDAGVGEHAAHQRRGNVDAELAELADGSDVPRLVFSRASRTISSRTSSAIGGRPVRRCGYVQRRAIRRRCQRSSVSGRTGNLF